ncbi:MAG: hypothetical protein U0797_21580 [Gemmataceae bacterium]
MNLTLRSSPSPFGLLTAVLVTAARSPGLPGRPAPAPPTPEPCTRLVLPPSEEVLILARRSEAKAGVVEKLLADELTLVEAAAWFHRLNSEPPSQPCESWKLRPATRPRRRSAGRLGRGRPGLQHLAGPIRRPPLSAGGAAESAASAGRHRAAPLRRGRAVRRPPGRA